ncbi:MAG: GNAT family N-acetyltransferase [Pseudomonadota bacterium]
MHLRRLVPSDATAYQSLRLAALQDSPSAFGSSYEEECDTPLATIAAHMAPDSGRYRFGAFDGEQLVGVVGFARESAPKLRHKGFIRGMYVAPTHRARGAGRQLLEQALDCAAAMEGLRRLTLTVTAGNASAQGLYLAKGFTVFGHEPCGLYADGAYYDVIHMALIIS